MRGCDGSGYVGEFELHGEGAKCPGCPACWTKDDWRILHHAASMAVQIYDRAEQEGGVPRSAPLYGKRDRLLELARGLDHTARHGLTRPYPQPEQCGGSGEGRP